MKKLCFLLFIPVFFLFHSCTKDGSSANNNSSNSIGGSLARFTLVGNYLYTVDQQRLKTYNVSNPAMPMLQSTVDVGPDIETIFPYKGYLYIGSNTTAYRYSISNPAQPIKSSQVVYLVLGRDPIVANDTLAYSTLRTGTNSGVLNIINIKNSDALTITNRLILNTTPYGLGLADTALYVCENSAGLKVYSIAGSMAYNPVVRKVFTNSEAYYDVIPFGNLLYAWIEGGNSIFDITNRMNPILLSKTKN